MIGIPGPGKLTLYYNNTTTINDWNSQTLVLNQLYNTTTQYNCGDN